MSKFSYRGNLTKEELKELEAERKEAQLERQERRSKDLKIRKARDNRHTDWSEAID